MSRNNWAEKFSNTERELFAKGNWSLTVDGEQSWSLYYGGNFVSTILDYNQYKLFEKGFILMREENNVGSYCLYSSNSRVPLFSSDDNQTKCITDEDFITFETKYNKTMFDAHTLSEIFITDENQIGINF